MKRILIVLGLLLGLTTGVAQAQTRVGVSLSFGDPYFNGQVVIGQPYYHRYARASYYRYRPYYHRVPVVVVAPRYERVVIVRRHRNYHRYH
ncbi:MAG TPA: hypothetical protein VN513_09210 [Gemmatimonadales bacterium]|jgi:hypothetical protein|nr:hypothetical protein [Gemmatimonadales bacterium]